MDQSDKGLLTSTENTWRAPENPHSRTSSVRSLLGKLLKGKEDPGYGTRVKNPSKHNPAQLSSAANPISYHRLCVRVTK